MRAKKLCLSAELKRGLVSSFPRQNVCWAVGTLTWAEYGDTMATSHGGTPVTAKESPGGRYHSVLPNLTKRLGSGHPEKKVVPVLRETGGFWWLRGPMAFFTGLLICLNWDLWWVRLKYVYGGAQNKMLNSSKEKSIIFLATAPQFLIKPGGEILNEPLSYRTEPNHSSSLSARSLRKAPPVARQPPRIQAAFEQGGAFTKSVGLFRNTCWEKK